MLELVVVVGAAVLELVEVVVVEVVELVTPPAGPHPFHAGPHSSTSAAAGVPASATRTATAAARI